MSKEGLTLREIQLSMLDVLKKVHEICEENDIKYYLAYGTLLGAIRHKGYIPWDDDTDIWLFREDFEKLKEVFRKESYQIGPIKFCNRANTDKYMFYIPRISDTGYRYLMEKSKQQVGDMGIFIDVYPIDSIDDNNDKVKAACKKIKKINSLYRFYIDYRESSNVIKTILKAPIHASLRLLYGKNYPNMVDERINKIISEVEKKDGKLSAVIGWDTDAIVFYDTEKLKERVMVEFEGTKLWAPKEYDYILSKTYGDYMQLPPEEDRNPYHGYIIVKK